MKDLYEVLTASDIVKYVRELSFDKAVEVLKVFLDYGMYSVISSQDVKPLAEALLDKYVEAKQESKDRSELLLTEFLNQVLPLRDAITLAYQYRSNEPVREIMESIVKNYYSSILLKKKLLTTYQLLRSPESLDIAKKIFEKLRPSVITELDFHLESSYRDMFFKLTPQVHRNPVVHIAQESDLVKLFKLLKAYSRSDLEYAIIGISFREKMIQLNPSMLKKSVLSYARDIFGDNLEIQDTWIEAVEDASIVDAYMLGRIIGYFYNQGQIDQVYAKFSTRSLYPSYKFSGKSVPINKFLSKYYVDRTASFMAGFYSIVPFQKMKARLSEDILQKYPILGCRLIAAGAPMNKLRVECIYQALSREDKYKSVAEKLLFSAIEERSRHGYNSVLLPREVLNLSLAETSTPAFKLSDRSKVL